MKKRVGQAYELANETVLSLVPSEKNSFLWAKANNPSHVTSVNKNAKTISLSTLIQSNPAAILGQKVIDIYGPVMPLLIKFTQAQNNSYQAHVKTGQSLKQYRPKPESWYFFEQGKVTLGLAQSDRVEEYKDRCAQIHRHAQELSHAVMENKLTVSQAKETLNQFINHDHPNQYVNTLYIEKNEVVDISQGGLHHSWEKAADIPLGNILYEVQLDVKDDVSTLRSFDQGSIKDDGTIRPLQIEDYFAAIDTSPGFNEPEQYRKKNPFTATTTNTVKTIFDNQYYKMQEFDMVSDMENEETTTANTFHHLFLKSGKVILEVKNQKFPLKRGWSLFIPAAVGSYRLIPTQPSVILKTFV